MTKQSFVRLLLAVLCIAPFISQSLMDLAWALLVLTMIVLYVLAKKSAGDISWRPQRIGVEAIWIVWIAIVAIGFIANGKINADFVQRTLEVFGVVYLVYAIAAGLNYLKLELSRIVQFVLIFMAIQSIASIAMYLIQGEERLRGLILNSMTYAHDVGIVFLFLATLFLCDWKNLLAVNSRRWLWLGSLAVIGLSLLLALTRGVWIEVGVALLIVAFLLSWRVGLVVSASLVASVVTLLLIWPKFRNRVFFVFDFENNYDSERIILWKTNWAIFKDHVFVGTGYGENTKLLGQYYQSLGYSADQFISHAHNQYLHILAGTGVLGLLFYLAMHLFFIVLAYRLFKSAPANSLRKYVALGIFAAQVGFAVGGLTESNFEHAKVRMVLFLFWGLLVYLKQNPLVGAGSKDSLAG